MNHFTTKKKATGKKSLFYSFCCMSNSRKCFSMKENINYTIIHFLMLDQVTNNFHTVPFVVWRKEEDSHQSLKLQKEEPGSLIVFTSLGQEKHKLLTDSIFTLSIHCSNTDTHTLHVSRPVIGQWITILACYWLLLADVSAPAWSLH